MTQVAASSDAFRAGSVTHGLVLVGLLFGCGLVVKLAEPRSDSRRRDRAVAGVLLALWLFLLVRGFLPGHFRWDHSLPLHVCDLVGLAAPVALLTGRRLLRSIVYYWGLGLSSQAFITPMLFKGPTQFAFWAYWSCHAVIIWAAVYEVVVRHYRPTWADYRKVVLAGAVYAIVVFPVNLRLGVNYGYMGQTDFCQTGLIKALGDWPGRLPKLLALVWGGMAMMTLPWAGLPVPLFLHPARQRPATLRLQQPREPRSVTPARAA